MEGILKKPENIYEMVAVMAKRARQVNDEQKRQIEMEMEIPQSADNKDNEDFDEVEIDREALMREYKIYPKPTQVAIDETQEGKVDYRYIDEEETEKTVDKKKES
jgi:DNA-directed RNA polymerase subunit K/omega